MRDMVDKSMGIYLQDRTIIFLGLSQVLKFEIFSLIHEWDPQDMMFPMYTKPKLMKTHLVFLHPSINDTRGLIMQVSGGSLDRKTRYTIDKISDQCKICKKNAPSPRRFKLTVCSDSRALDHFMQVDTMFQRRKSMLEAELLLQVDDIFAIGT